MSTHSQVQFLQHKKRYFFLEICSVILVQDTARTLRVKLDILRISSSPLSVRLSHWINFSTSRFGREFTPTPTPVMLEPDKSNSLILLLDLFNISISPWFDNDHQLFSTSFSRLGRVLGRLLNISPVDTILWTEMDLRLILESTVNTISFSSSVLLTPCNLILIVSSSSCFSTKYLNTGPQTRGLSQEIFNSKKYF